MPLNTFKVEQELADLDISIVPINPTILKEEFNTDYNLNYIKSEE